jgi:nucleoside-diphosphate-sugar epimerase
MSEKKIAIVAGAAGIIGRNLILHLDKSHDWEIIAICRRPLDFESRAKHISLDLLDKEKTNTAMKDLKGTHIFFAAYIDKQKLVDQIPPNLTMLQNLVEAVEAGGTLKHVCLAEGSKWYSLHLGPTKTPWKEDDARGMPPMFYYNQEDYLSNRSKSKGWTWSGTRPNPVCGFALGNPMNLVTAIATYGTICKELNLPFRFPGTAIAYEKIVEVCDVEILCSMMVWSSVEPKAANNAFNVSNGDVFRWKTIWPALARFFGLELDHGPILNMSLAQMMEDKEGLWNSIVEKNKLKKTAFKDLAAWPFADFIFQVEYDCFGDLNKARRLGFNEMTLDSQEMFLRQLQQLRDDKIIP